MGFGCDRLDQHQGPSLGGWRKGGAFAQGIGTSRGGRTSKIHGLTDTAGRPRVLLISPGNLSDMTMAPALITAAAGWDELVQGGCVGREARFYLNATKFYNFEVEWDVTKVKLYSPTEMDLYTTTKGEDGGQYDEVWEFKLVDGALTGRKPGATFFRRCPDG